MSGDVGLTYEFDFADISVSRNDIVQDEGLETAVIVSLFTDRRIRVDELPATETDRAGWWGDMIPDVEGDQIGSKLWLLRREKQTQQTLIRYQEYSEEALQWLIEDGIATGVSVVATYPRREVINLVVTIQKPQGVRVFNYSLNWKKEGEKR